MNLVLGVMSKVVMPGSEINKSAEKAFSQDSVLSVLNSMSPMDLVMAMSPFTRLFAIHPPAASIRSSSLLLLVGRWSSVICLTLPSSKHSTALQSPTHPMVHLFDRTHAIVAQEPLVSQCAPSPILEW